VIGTSFIHCDALRTLGIGFLFFGHDVLRWSCDNWLLLRLRNLSGILHELATCASSKLYVPAICDIMQLSVFQEALSMR